jgi:cystathionine beta-lyase
MEKTYDFDKVVDRSGSHAIKFEALKEYFGREDLIPLWVADMDFETPDFIVEAMRKRLDHPVFGYTAGYDSYWQSIERWLLQQHGWQVERKWMRYIPGIVKGIAMVLQAFTQAGDKIIIQPPVYHPFRLVPEKNGREVVFNPLKPCKDGYCMDFEHLESILDERCKVLILSNPHNPAGIVWDKVTLQRLAEIATRHHLIVISDEIHADMALFGHKHTPFATVSDDAANCSITFGAPSKTFNIAGIVSSYTIVPNEVLREKFFSWLEANEMDMATIFAMTATEAAFNNGENWRKEMLRYVEQNIVFIEEFLAKELPQVKLLRPQASFLVWLDFSALGLQHDELIDMLINRAHLALNDGKMFGPGGEQHARLNVGTQRSVLAQAMKQLKEAIDNL